MNMAWLDLETTGSDERAGSVVEVGVVVTDEYGDVLAEWETLVRPDPDHWTDMKRVVADMHLTSGLTAAVSDGMDWLPYPNAVDEALAQFLHPWTVRGCIILAGSGVGHFDSRWLRWHLPRSAALFTYWTMDVGVLRRFLLAVDERLVRGQTDKPHRALADAHLHLDEWRFYRRLLFDCRGDLIDAARIPDPIR